MDQQDRPVNSPSGTHKKPTIYSDHENPTGFHTGGKVRSAHDLLALAAELRKKKANPSTKAGTDG